VDVLLGPFSHTIPPHDYLSSFRSSPPPHHVWYFACDFRSKRLIIISHHLSISELPLIPPLTTGHKVPFLVSSHFPLSRYYHGLLPLSFSSLPFFSSTYVTRCHLEPPSTLALPEPFPLRLSPPLLHFRHTHTHMVDEFLLVTVVRTIKNMYLDQKLYGDTGKIRQA